MARSSKVEACMLCGQLPCECNAKPPSKPKKSAKPKIGPTATVATLQNTDSRPATVASATKLPEPTVTASPRISVRLRDADELLEEECIRILAPLLSRADRIKYRMILNSELSPAERALVWKRRRRSG